jgi:hypothetical protein
VNPKPKILLHKDELKSIGIDIKSLSLLTDVMHPAHRDDHFMFIIQAKGSLPTKSALILKVLNT